MTKGGPPEPGERPLKTGVPNLRLRNVFTLTSLAGSGGREYHTITAPKRGPDRQRAKRAIMTVLRRADRLSHRVSFVLTFSDYSQLSMFELGFDPGLALAHCQSHRDDPYAWFSERSQGEAASRGGHVIIGVNILTWPRDSSNGG
jgi:hypothetical protein